MLYIGCQSNTSQTKQVKIYQNKIYQNNTWMKNIKNKLHWHVYN